MRKTFSTKWIYLIERRSFDQKYKFSDKNDIVCAWRDFNSTFCVLSRYPKRPVRIEKSSIFNFEYVKEVLDVKRGEISVTKNKTFLSLFKQSPHKHLHMPKNNNQNSLYEKFVVQLLFSLTFYEKSIFYS